MEENIGTKLLDLRFQGAREVKAKLNEWDYIKLKSFFIAKEQDKEATN